MELRFGDVLCISGDFLAKSDRTLSFLGGVLFFSVCDTKLLTIKKQCDTIISEGVRKMCENAKKCSSCGEHSSEMVLVTVTQDDEKKFIWICQDCYNELFGEN